MGAFVKVVPMETAPSAETRVVFCLSYSSAHRRVPTSGIEAYLTAGLI